MRSVMVTGATTPVGRALVERLLARGDVERILAVGVEPDGIACSAGARGRLRYEQTDLTKPRRVQALLFGPARELGVDTIVHTALHRSPFKVGRRAHALNVDATRELLRLAERHPTMERFVLRSWAEVYRVDANQSQVIDEDHPLNLSPEAPQWIRDRVEADVAACMRMGMSKLKVTVLRCAECLAEGTGSQLYDYLSSAVCFRPIGFDPMIDLITLADLSRALALAAAHDGQGVFNIPGRDTLPLSEIIYLSRRREIAVPDGLLFGLYRLRTRALGTEFRYDLNQGRFHLGAVLGGGRAKAQLGYAPEAPIAWPLRSSEGVSGAGTLSASR